MLCLLSGGLVLGQLISFFICNKGEEYSKLIKVLDEKQRKILEKVSKERMELYIRGQIFGVLLGIVLVYLLKNPKIPLAMYGCLFVLTIYTTTYLYYRLSPKSDFLVRHLDKEEQRVAWLGMYNHMSRCHLIGSVMGIAGYFMFMIFMMSSKIKK